MEGVSLCTASELRSTSNNRSQVTFRAAMPRESLTVVGVERRQKRAVIVASSCSFGK